MRKPSISKYTVITPFKYEILMGSVIKQYLYIILHGTRFIYVIMKIHQIPWSSTSLIANPEKVAMQVQMLPLKMYCILCTNACSCNCLKTYMYALWMLYNMFFCVRWALRICFKIKMFWKIIVTCLALSISVLQFQ